MKSIEFFVFRHGETDWNREKRFQGHTDIPLNTLGKRQALDLSLQIRELDPQVILSSDLTRAIETTQIVNERLRVPVVQTSALRECSLGDVEGEVIDKVIEKFGKTTWENWRSVKTEHLDFSFPNGETKRQHLRRMINFIEKFIDEQSHLKRVAISTHGGSLRRLVHNCLGAPEIPVHIPNCSLYKINYDLEKSIWYIK